MSYQRTGATATTTTTAPSNSWTGYVDKGLDWLGRGVDVFRSATDPAPRQPPPGTMLAPQQSGGISMNTMLLIGGIGLAAFFLLKKKR